ncbi:MAG: tetratricopeptide repeat protein [Nitrospirota bacterium]|nr:tetratricopeptide repeat protein [Nitrospirota bacterium]MDE3242083.1 tetratricopeptide repeat protein [Nitrospirota bacterium]
MLQRVGRIVLTCLLCWMGGWSGCSSEEAFKRADGYYTEGLANLDGDRQKAFVSFQKAIQENPKHRDAHYYSGHIYAIQGKYAQAEGEFREAVRIDPDYSEAYNYLGQVLKEQDRWQEAIAAYRRALANPLYETPDVARVNLGRALAHQGDMQGAAEAFEDALLVRPSNVSPAMVHLELGRAYYRLGYDAKARDLLTRVAALDKEGQFTAEANQLLERLRP